MKKLIILNVITSGFILGSSFLSPNTFNSSTQAQTVIKLTQTGCQFLETETKNYNYQPKKADDCNKINGETLKNRKQGFKTITLSQGKYVFNVTNKNVPYELGFYLRGQGVSQALLPKVSGGGLTEGKTMQYSVDLKKGKYYISCPLNPTPDYTVIVQ
jgi:hypothetical protein